MQIHVLNFCKNPFVLSLYVNTHFSGKSLLLVFQQLIGWNIPQYTRLLYFFIYLFFFYLILTLRVAFQPCRSSS